MRSVRHANSDTPTLLERQAELAAIDGLLGAARSGRGATLVVEGPAGIGKTSLLVTARQRAAERAMRVLYGKGSELERDFPLGVVRQCLEPALRRDADRARLLTGAARLAGPALLDLHEPVEAHPLGILHGLYWLVDTLAQDGPVLVAVDDAHWADEPSLRFVAYLARRIESVGAALLIGTRGDEDVSPECAAALGEIRAEPATVRVEPSTLATDAVERLLAELAAGPVDEAFARACREATGGNPFLLGELGRALQADGVPFTAAGVTRITQVTPPTVARAVGATLARLGDPATQIARAAAVLGDGAALPLVAQLAALPLAEATKAADELARAGIAEDAAVLRFCHPILMGAVWAGASAHERAALHAGAAALLRTRGATPERVALQLLHTPPAADDRVVAELRLASEHARERGAPGTAVALLERALDEPPDAALRAEVLFELGRAELASVHTGDPAEHLREAHRCAADPLVRGRAAALLAQASPGDPASRREIARLVAEALPEVEARDRELALRLRAVLVLNGGSVEGVPLDGSTVGEAVVLGNLVFPSMGPEAVAADIASIAERAARQADALLDEGAMPLAFTGMVLGLRWADRLDAARGLLDRAIQSASRRGSVPDFAAAMTLRATVQRRAGRLREAEADARGAFAAALGPQWSFARGIAPLVGTLVDQGRVQEAAKELEAVLPGAEIPDSPPMTPVLLARMSLRAARREYDPALADWAEAGRRAEGSRGINAAWVEDLVVVADVHHAIGDECSAGAAAAHALALARCWDTPGAIGQALHAQARVGAAGEPVEVLRAAVGLLAESPVRLEHARCLITLGSLLRRRRLRAESRDPLREGHELARRCGADQLAELARAELRASGIRLRRQALTGAEALTPSEERIAQMASGGLSNGEIAQALFLTVKTVEMHLTNAYRKLDIRRRAQLAEALGGKP